MPNPESTSAAPEDGEVSSSQTPTGKEQTYRIDVHCGDNGPVKNGPFADWAASDWRYTATPNILPDNEPNKAEPDA